MDIIQYARDKGYTVYDNQYGVTNDSKAIYIDISKSAFEQKRDIVLTILRREGVEDVKIMAEASKILVPLDKLKTLEHKYFSDDKYISLGYSKERVYEVIAKELGVSVGMVNIRRSQGDNIFSF